LVPEFWIRAMAPFAPADPVGPVAPVGPCGPVGPWGPVGPCAPVTVCGVQVLVVLFHTKDCPPAGAVKEMGRP